jgi:hypothetical protein
MLSLPPSLPSCAGWSVCWCMSIAIAALRSPIHDNPILSLPPLPPRPPNMTTPLPDSPPSDDSPGQDPCVPGVAIEALTPRRWAARSSPSHLLRVGVRPLPLIAIAVAPRSIDRSLARSVSLCLYAFRVPDCALVVTIVVSWGFFVRPMRNCNSRFLS